MKIINKKEDKKKRCAMGDPNWVQETLYRNSFLPRKEHPPCLCSLASCKE